MANTITYQDLADRAKELGEQSGKGKDTQIKFMLSLVEGGYHNALDLSANKHGQEVDDAAKLSEIYVKSQQGSTVFDTKTPATKVLIAKSRSCIKLGGWPKGGNGEPLATVNNLMTHRQNLRKDPTKCKKLDDAANTLLKYARAQLKRDTLIDAIEFDDLCFKKQADPATIEDIIERTVKQLDKLIDGSAAHGTAQSSTPNVISARQSLRKELSAIATARNPQNKTAPAKAGV